MAGNPGSLAMPDRRPRRPNFQRREVDRITDEVLRAHSLLFGVPAREVEPARVQRTWEAIRARAREASGVDRPVASIRRRWLDTSREVRLKAEGILQRSRDVQPRGRSRTPHLVWREWEVLRLDYPDLHTAMVDAGYHTPEEGSEPAAVGCGPGRTPAVRRRRPSRLDPTSSSGSSSSQPSPSHASPSSPPSSSASTSDPPLSAGPPVSPHPLQPCPAVAPGLVASGAGGVGHPSVSGVPGRGLGVVGSPGTPAGVRPVVVQGDVVVDVLEEVRTVRREVAEQRVEVAAVTAAVVSLRGEMCRQHAAVMGLLGRLLPRGGEGGVPAGPGAAAGDLASSPDIVVVKPEEGEEHPNWLEEVRRGHPDSN